MALNIARRGYLNIFRVALQPSRYTSSAPSNEPDFDKLIKNNKVVVFMKGVPDEPRCGFSNAVVQILRMHGVSYDSHDVLKDEAIRNGKLATLDTNSLDYN